MYNPNDPRLSPQTILDQQFNINQYSHSSFSAMGSLQDDMTGTLRSLRDTIATSFQTLNLTLSSMNSTLRTMTNATSTSMSSFGSNSFIPAQQVMAFTGAMSAPMVDAISNKSYFGMMTERRPYNISPWEWNTTVQDEMNFRAAGLLSGAGAIGTQMTAATLAGNWVQRAVNKSFPKFAGKFPLSGFGFAAGIGAQFVLDPVVEAFNERAEEHLRDMAGIQRMSTQFSNKQFSLNQAHTVASSINRFGINEAFNSSPFEARLGTDGYRNVLMQGLQQGMFQGTTPEQLVKQVEQAAHVVKFLTGILGSKDVNETMQAVANLKNMGVNAFQNSAFTNKLGASAFQYSSIMGVTGADLVNQSMQHAQQVGSMFGMPGYMGIMPTMQSMALAHSLEKSRNLSAAELSVAGGYQQVGRNMATFYGATMASPNVGGVALLAGMGAGGTFSRGAMMSNFQNGGYYGLLGAAAQNASDPRKMLAYMANRTNMMDSFMKQGGSMQDMVNTVLHSAMQNAPFATESVDSFAAYLMQLGPSVFGQNLDEATAKALAYGALNPERSTAIEKQGQRNLNRGIFQTARKEFSWYSKPLKLWDQMGHIPSWIKQNTIGRFAEHSAYTVADMGGVPQSYYSGAPGTISNLLSFQLSNPGLDYNQQVRSMYEPSVADRERDFYYVSSRLQNNGYNYSSGQMRGFYSDEDKDRATARMLETLKRDPMHLKRIKGEGLSGDTSNYLIDQLRAQLPANLFRGDTNSIVDSYDNIFYGGSKGDYRTYGGHLHLLKSLGLRNFEKMEEDFYRPFIGNDAFSEKLALALQGAGLNPSEYKSAQALYDDILGSAKLNPSALGLQNKQQLAGVAVRMNRGRFKRATGADANDLDKLTMRQRFESVIPESTRDLYDAASVTLMLEHGDTLGYSDAFRNADSYNGELSMNKIAQGLALGGLSINDLSSFRNSEDLKTYNTVLGHIAVGFENNQAGHAARNSVNDIIKTLPKEQAMKLQRIMATRSEWMSKLKDDGVFSKMMNRYGNLDTANFDKFVGTFGALGNAGIYNRQEEMLKGIQDVFKFSDTGLESFRNAFASGNYKDIEEFLKTNTDSRSWKTVQQSMANFSSMWIGESSITRENADVLAKQLGLKDAAELQGKGYNKDQIMRQLFMNTVNGVKVGADKEKAGKDTTEAMSKMNQAFVPADGGGYAMKMVFAAVDKARLERERLLENKTPMPAQQPPQQTGPTTTNPPGTWGH